MKKMLETLVAIKGQAAMFFGGAIALYVVIGWWLGHEALPFILIVQMAFLSLICAGLSYLCFIVDTKHRPAERVIGFLLLMYLSLSAFAFFGAWFPMTLTAWLIYTGIFLIISAIMFGIYGAYFRITGTKYNQMLMAYKTRHAAESET